MAAVMTDLHWLIHQGHVIEFANGSWRPRRNQRPVRLKRRDRSKYPQPKRRSRRPDRGCREASVPIPDSALPTETPASGGTSRHVPEEAVGRSLGEPPPKA
jgi:hypothetical protein